MSATSANEALARRKNSFGIAMMCVGLLGVAVIALFGILSVTASQFEDKFESVYGVTDFSETLNGTIVFDDKDGIRRECLRVNAADLGKPLTCYAMETLTP